MAHASGAAVDEHPLPLGQLTLVAQSLQSRERRERHGGGLLERQALRQRSRRALPHHGILGVSAAIAAVEHGKDRIARLELGDLRADGLHLAGDVVAEDEWKAGRRQEPHRASPGLRVERIHARRAHSHENLSGASLRLLCLPDPEAIRTTMAVDQRGFHGTLIQKLLRSARPDCRRTFPRDAPWHNLCHMFHVGNRHLEDAFFRHRDVGLQERPNDSHLLLPIYSAECGLKRLLLKSRSVHTTERLDEDDLTHDLDTLLRKRQV